VRTNCPTLSSANVQAQFTTPVNTGCPGIYDVPANDSRNTAPTIPLNVNIKGLIDVATDIDFYRFNIATGGTISITLTTLPANYDLRLIDGAGNNLITSKNAGTANETINTTVAAGSYFARIYPAAATDINATLCYTFRVATGTASFGDENNLLVLANKAPAIHPNPAKDKIIVLLAGLNGMAEIVITDANGKTLLRQKTAQAQTSLNISKLASGIYMIKAIQGGKTNNWKFVKE
jgi:hypothetical protein